MRAKFLQVIASLRNAERIVVVNAARPMEEIHAEICALVADL